MAYQIHNNKVKIGDTTIGTTAILDTTAVAETLKEEVVTSAIAEVQDSIQSVPNGGRKGQVLAKASNEDGDFVWTNMSGGPDGGVIQEDLENSTSTGIGPTKPLEPGEIDENSFITYAQLIELLGAGLKVDEESGKLTLNLADDATLKTTSEGQVTLNIPYGDERGY